jgi:hypothetical protein
VRAVDMARACRTLRMGGLRRKMRRALPSFGTVWHHPFEGWIHRVHGAFLGWQPPIRGGVHPSSPASGCHHLANRNRGFADSARNELMARPNPTSRKKHHPISFQRTRARGIPPLPSFSKSTGEIPNQARLKGSFSARFKNSAESTL